MTKEICDFDERIYKMLEDGGIIITFGEVVEKYSSDELREKVNTWFGIHMIKVQNENNHLRFINKNLLDSLNYWKNRFNNLQNKMKDPLDELMDGILVLKWN